jgi:hypothetical protein
MGCQTTVAQSILDAGADYLLAVKGNQPTLHAEIESYFATAPAAEVEKVETIDKDHGRFEVRNYSVSHRVDWYAAGRSYPGAPRFPQLTTIAMVESRIERGDKIESERRPLSVTTIQRLPQRTIDSSLPNLGTLSPRATLRIVKELFAAVGWPNSISFGIVDMLKPLAPFTAQSSVQNMHCEPSES